jgi:hypothetical protein
MDRFRIVGVWVQLASVAAEEADLGMEIPAYRRIIGKEAIVDILKPSAAASSSRVRFAASGLKEEASDAKVRRHAAHREIFRSRRLSVEKGGEAK